jgi:transcriptional regulator with XRE-family HTH domain
MSVFSKRLKEARRAAGLSQEKLGVLAGIDEMSSSARMNQYERGKHVPDFSLVTRVAGVLDVPECYLWCSDDDMAALLVQLHRIPSEQRTEALKAAGQLLREIYS